MWDFAVMDGTVILRKKVHRTTRCVRHSALPVSNYKTTSQLQVVTVRHFRDLVAGAANWSSVPERLKVQKADVNWEGNLQRLLTLVGLMWLKHLHKMSEM